MAARLSHAQLAEVRKRLFERQGGRCDICAYPFTKTDGAVLDHCHETGLIRGLIHRSCNAGEGKMRIQARWSFANVSPTDFMISLGIYLQKYKTNPRELIHPSWLSPDEKKTVKLLTRPGRKK